MNRLDRIEEARKKLSNLNHLKELIDDTEAELKEAEASFEIGESCSVKTYCRAGCCVESDYKGIIEGLTDNHCYNIRRDDGGLSTYASSFDMKRI